MLSMSLFNAFSYGNLNLPWLLGLTGTRNKIAVQTNNIGNIIRNRLNSLRFLVALACDCSLNSIGIAMGVKIQFARSIIALFAFDRLRSGKNLRNTYL